METEYEVNNCSVCKKLSMVTKTKFAFSIDCMCCTPFHFQEVLHCPGCTPEFPKTISYKSKSGVDVVGIKTELLTYIYGN